MIIRGGENIYPAEVEATLIDLDAVAEAAIVCVPHPELGEVPVAFIVSREPGVFDREKILADCRARLSPFKVPYEIFEIDEIPRTGSGKIQRFRLLQRLKKWRAQSMRFNYMNRGGNGPFPSGLWLARDARTSRSPHAATNFVAFW